MKARSGASKQTAHYAVQSIHATRCIQDESETCIKDTGVSEYQSMSSNFSFYVNDLNRGFVPHSADIRSRSSDSAFLKLRSYVPVPTGKRSRSPEFSVLFLILM